MIVTHYKCDRCGKDGQGSADELPSGWRVHMRFGELRGGGLSNRITDMVVDGHYCSTTCALPPRYAHVPWSIRVGGDRFLGRHGDFDLYFARTQAGEPCALARRGDGAQDFVHGWDSIAAGLCEAERRARALGLVEEKS